MNTLGSATMLLSVVVVCINYAAGIIEWVRSINGDAFNIADILGSVGGGGEGQAEGNGGFAEKRFHKGNRIRLFVQSVIILCTLSASANLFLGGVKLWLKG